jgi:hypothetical protein
MGWLRIVRPGSVIGPQQAYLCRMEAAARSAGDVFCRRGPAVALSEPGVAGVPSSGGCAACPGRPVSASDWRRRTGEVLRLRRT